MRGGKGLYLRLLLVTVEWNALTNEKNEKKKKKTKIKYPRK